MKNLFVFFSIISICLLEVKAYELIPNPKEYQENTGTFVFKEDTKIIINNNNSKLRKIAETFVSDLYNLKSKSINIIDGNSPEPNSIMLSINSSSEIKNNQGYTIEVSDRINISAVSDTGVFYATRTILQLLNHTDSIKFCKITDYPDYPERGMMIDNGRKYYSVSNLKDYIKDLAYLKMNIFHFHISDNEGFRLKSDNYPQLSSSQFYTKDEIKELISLADKYYINIIPEIDMPNHMGQIMRNLPEYQIKDKSGYLVGACCIDYSLPEAQLFIKNIIEEFSDLFTSNYWHVGADELTIDSVNWPQFKALAVKYGGEKAQANDSFTWFINYVNSIVKGKGKSLRAWSDALNNYKFTNPCIKLDDDIVFEFWDATFHPDSIFKAGYKVMNSNSENLYFVVGNGLRPNPKSIIENWNPKIMNKKNINPEYTNQITGAKVQIWTDFPQALTEMQVFKEMFLPLRALSEKTWNGVDSTTTIEIFSKIADYVGNAPGVKIPTVLIPNDLCLLKPIYSSSDENTNLSANYAVDGDYTTRWSSKYTDNESLVVDLQRVYYITRLQLMWEYSFAVDYQIMFSKDSITWNTVLDITDNKGGTNNYANLQDSTRFIKVNCTKRSNSCGFSLYEIEAYDSTSIINSSVNNYFINNMIAVNPNPIDSKSIINISLAKPGNIKLMVFDLLGNLIEYLYDNYTDKQRLTFEYSPNNIEKGLYYFVLSSNDETVVKPIMYLGN